jgi:eukaryotic-like serine/threonine-protein kinase
MVLDFGVAKLLDRSNTGIDRTATGLLQALTPNYASPEQLRGLPVTTASDIYALGVLLYEVLTNVRPYDTTGQPLDRVLDLVLKTDPVRPSAIRLRSPATFPYDSRRLAGDLDAIVLKALRKEPDARYTSAEALADDIARFLAGQPVFAREHSTGYLLRKVAARHKAAAVMGGLAAVGLVTALTVTIWQWRVADEERFRAEQRLNEVHQLANALVFKLHEAVIAVPGATKARRVIVDEARVYLERLAREAPGRDQLQIDLARAYRELGSILGKSRDPQPR